MERDVLLEYLYAHIPMSRALGVEVVECSESGVVLRAPFLPNVNHKCTVFGGSLHAVAALACWSLVFVRLEELRPEIVIVESHMKYEKPAASDFSATAVVPSVQQWDRFVRVFERKGAGKISIEASLATDCGRVAHFTGVFAAYRRDTILP